MTQNQSNQSQSNPQPQPTVVKVEQSTVQQPSKLEVFVTEYMEELKTNPYIQAAQNLMRSF